MEKHIMLYPQARKVPKEKRDFICRAYTGICSNLLFEWIEEGIPDEQKANLEDYLTLTTGSLEAALDRFQSIS